MYETNSKDEKEKVIQNQRSIANTDFLKTEENKLELGEIIVTSILEDQENEGMQGVKINLYKINGLSPVLITSETTDKEGKAIFSNIQEGCYRIIEIIDKRYFEKPKYKNWNEIIIDEDNKTQKVIIINKIKKIVQNNKHNKSILN